MAWLNEHGVVLKNKLSNASKLTPYRFFSKHNVRILERNSGGFQHVLRATSAALTA